MKQTMALVAGLAALLVLAACAAPAPTATPPPTPTPTPTVLEVTYQDPPGDCLRGGDNSPVACDPQGIDILSVTITRASPLTIVLELAGPGVASLSSYGVVHGLDLDRDAGTGNSDWPELHAMAPDLAVGFFPTDGQTQSLVIQYAADGIGTELDPGLAQWTVLDDNHIQVVLDESLAAAESFAIAGDVFLGEIYDHYVDGGHVVFPSGEVVLLQ